MANDLTPRDLILKYGDLLEKAMFADEEFASAFHLYPHIWSKYILHRRDNETPSLKSANWQPFAEHHYSAIVRCWGMYQSRGRIEHMCNTLDCNAPDHGIWLLDIHATLLTFFCSAGGAIENMERAFSQPPLSIKNRFTDMMGNPNDCGSLKWLYARRTQAIHKIIVPIYLSDGFACLDTSLFDDKEVSWRDATMLSSEEVFDLLYQIWDKFVHQMTGVWSVLFDLLKDRCIEPQPIPITDLTRLEYEGTSDGHALRHIDLNQIFSPASAPPRG